MINKSHAFLLYFKNILLIEVILGRDIIVVPSKASSSVILGMYSLVKSNNFRRFVTYIIRKQGEHILLLNFLIEFRERNILSITSNHFLIKYLYLFITSNHYTSNYFLIKYKYLFQDRSYCCIILRRNNLWGWPLPKPNV